MTKCARCGKELGKVHGLRMYCKNCQKEAKKKHHRDYMRRRRKTPEGKIWLRNQNKKTHKKNMEKQDFLRDLPPDQLLRHVRGLK